MHVNENQWRSQAGAHALVTGGCASPVQALLKIIGAECTVINCELGAKVHKGVEIEPAQYCYLYLQDNEVHMLP